MRLLRKLLSAIYVKNSAPFSVITAAKKLNFWRSSFAFRNERFFPWKYFLAFLFYEPLKTTRKHLDGLQKIRRLLWNRGMLVKGNFCFVEMTKNFKIQYKTAKIRIEILFLGRISYYGFPICILDIVFRKIHTNSCKHIVANSFGLYAVNLTKIND